MKLLSRTDKYWIQLILRALKTEDLDLIDIAEKIRANSRNRRTELSELDLVSDLRSLTIEQTVNLIDDIIYEHLIDKEVFFDISSNKFTLEAQLSRKPKTHQYEEFVSCQELWDKRNKYKTISAEDRVTKYREEIISIGHQIEEFEAKCAALLKSFDDEDKSKAYKHIRDRELRRILRKLSSTETIVAEYSQSSRITSEIGLYEAVENWFNTENPEKPLVFPVIYRNYPKLGKLGNDSITGLINILPRYIQNDPDFLSARVIEDLRIAYAEESTDYRINALVYNLIHVHHSVEGRTEQFSDEWITLKKKLQNPLLAFFKLISRLDAKATYQSGNSEFDEILNEVCRNNKVTSAERLYLYEKAEEYCVDTSNLQSILDDPFIGNRTFKIFIDEICRDLIITESERAYIQEKANEYNVPEETLNLMIEDGLLSANLNEKFTRDKKYYEFVLATLIAGAFGTKNEIDNIKWIVNETLQESEHAIDLKENIQLILEVVLHHLPECISSWHQPTKIIEMLELECPDFTSAVEKYKAAENQSDSSITTSYDENFTFGNYTCKVRIEESPLQPLFWFKLDNGVNSISINKDHELYSEFDQSSLIKFLCVFYETKNSFFDGNGDAFERRFRRNLEQ